jgi:hypothetical protein
MFGSVSVLSIALKQRSADMGRGINIIVAQERCVCGGGKLLHDRNLFSW